MASVSPEKSVLVAWHDWLKKIGAVADGDRLTRVVIDVACDSVAKVYVEKYGSTAMLEVEPPDVEGTQVTVVGDGAKRTYT